MSEENVGGDVGVGTLGDTVERHEHSPVLGGRGADVLLSIVVGGFQSGVLSHHLAHHGSNVGAILVVTGVDDTEHALLAMLSDRAVEELRLVGFNGYID